MRKTYGYVRVSTKDQNEARQILEMQEFGIEKKIHLHGQAERKGL